MPPKAKEVASAHAKKVEDKTFGMKNKNKSKQVQAKIQQMHKGGGNQEARHGQQTPESYHPSPWGVVRHLRAQRNVQSAHD